MFNYHSIIFSSQTNPIFQDASFKNYSECPDIFYGRTDKKGFYFVYYYHYYYTKFQDTFNFSYFVFDCFDKYDFLSEDIIAICDCVKKNHSKNCYSPKNNTGVSFNSMDQNFDCLFCSRYLHAASNVGSYIYVHGGLSSKDISNQVFIRFYDNKWEHVPVDSEIQPPCLYGHSMDYNSRNHELVLFGGIVCGSSSVKENGGIVWIFEIKSQIWIEYHNYVSRQVIGHSIHVHNNVMYSFFGLAGSSLVPLIQKFNLDTMTWMSNISIYSTYKTIQGLAYHSSCRYGSEIWIYGGLFMKNSSSVFISNELYVFDLQTGNWTIVSDNGPRVYLHTCFIVNGILRIFGGFIAAKHLNNQSQTQFSKYIYQYDINRKHWTVSDKRLLSVGERLVLKDNYTVLIIGGKTSFYRSSIVEMSFKKSGFIIPTVKVSELYIQNVLGLFSFNNCSQLQCESCVRNMCAWCALTKSCISKIQLALSYVLGACDSPILYENQCPVKCEDLTNSGCHNCTKLQMCGWCEFRNEFVGVGKCIEGSIYGPFVSTNNSQVQKYCLGEWNSNNWSFLRPHCSSCNCNGHASCINTHDSISKCTNCHHNTTGDQCQFCKQGYQGSAINGNKCHLCKCLIDNSAGQCYSNGFCDEFCIEKGRIGKYCHECDVQNNFTKFQGMCVYNCKINLKYNLNEKTEFFNIYINRVRFLLSDLTSKLDLGFKIRCINSNKATVQVELYNTSGDGRLLIPHTNCAFFEKIFPRALFIGPYPYQMLFTVSGFRNSNISQFQVEIIFTQKTYTNLPFIFISLFACLFTAVLLFYTVFKIRQHMRRRNHDYHALMIMERPFVKITLKVADDVDNSPNCLEFNALLDSKNNDASSQLTGAHQYPLVCVEPVNFQDQFEESKRNCVTAVVTYLFQSPNCTSLSQMHNSHSKHTPCILIGSTVSKVTKRERKLLLELPTKSTSGNNLIVERDFDTSISPSAAEELVATDV